MVINISVQYNGGILTRHYTVDPRLQLLGNPVKYHVVALYLQPTRYVIVSYYYHV